EAADAARRCAPSRLDYRQCRGMGSDTADAANRTNTARGWLAHARCPELGLARIRQPGRLLANARGVRPFAYTCGVGDQWFGYPSIRADRPCRARTRVGVHRSWL